MTDIPAHDICTCKTEGGKLLEDVSPGMLETVIPRGDEPFVMILRGKYNGQVSTTSSMSVTSC